MITPEQVRGARAILRLTVAELAELADVRAMTISRYETGKADARGSTLAAIERALTAAGIVFGPDGSIRRVPPD